LTEGETWVREALAELREGGSLSTFLLASHRRAATTRRQRQRLARQARAWSAAGALAWTLPPVRSCAGPGLAWWCAVALMLDWHLGMVETEDGEPRMLGAADGCTLLRAWLVPLVAQDPRPFALALGLATDAADGALARRSAPTRAGRDLEGLVDSAFAVAALRGTVRAGRLGRPSAVLEAARLAAGFIYASAAYFGAGRPPSASLARAPRCTAPLRAAGVLAAAAGHRRAGGALLALGAAAGAAAALASIRRDTRPARKPWSGRRHRGTTR
jgi:phosphatidylglycerophosphate synthase